MKNLIENIILLIVGIFTGIGTPFEKFYLVFGVIIFTWLIIFIKVPIASNERIYLKVISVSIGFVLGHLLEVNLLFPLVEQEIMIIVGFFGAMSFVLFYGVPYLYYSWKQRREQLSCGERNKKKWAERNLFDERNADLKRLMDYICKNQVATLGIEGERGYGKSFLMEGFIEQLQEIRYLYITIEVMALRLDNFPEYLIGELDKLLYSQGIVAKNSTRLQKMLQGTKAEFFTHLWDGQEKYYTNLFQSFQQELLSLNCHIILIYEDIDRINNIDAIRNILYLSEKLSSQNEYWPDSGIHIVYQYSVKHMNKLGLDSQFLEKYIHQRMSLSILSFDDMVNSLQEETSREECFFLKSDDIYRLPPHMMVGRYPPLPQESEWVKTYFASNFTIRNVKKFLLKVKITLGDENRELEFSEMERNIGISMCFIEHFMPDTFQRLNVRPLYSAFYVSISADHAEYMGNICGSVQANPASSSQRRDYGDLLDMYGEWRDEARRYECLNPEHHPENFELYIAWRLLGMDGVDRLSSINYADYDD